MVSKERHNTDNASYTRSSHAYPIQSYQTEKIRTDDGRDDRTTTRGARRRRPRRRTRARTRAEYIDASHLASPRSLSTRPNDGAMLRARAPSARPGRVVTTTRTARVTTAAMRCAVASGVDVALARRDGARARGTARATRRGRARRGRITMTRTLAAERATPTR